GHDIHLPFSLTYHRRSQFTDFFSYSRMWEIIVFHKIESCPKLSKEAKGSLPQARLPPYIVK
ncbi:hypothetical protein, partial [Enterocloster clostridioformis]|uniref:hypothetical protein n=1 Tax=Enterocloster clostridioformis TaxID=1531 RepID=UPI0034A17DA9